MRPRTLLGRGTYVLGPPQRPQSLCMIAAGPCARDTTSVASDIEYAEKLARQRGLQLSLRYAGTTEELREALGAFSADPTVSAGLIVGAVEPCDLGRWAAESRLRWVLGGEFYERKRRAPVLDQVVYDWYYFFEGATRHLLERGARRPALFICRSEFVWSADKISAFRTACESAGLPPDAQPVVDLHAGLPLRHEPGPPYVRHLARSILRALVVSSPRGGEPGDRGLRAL